MMLLVAMLAAASVTVAKPLGDPRSWITSDDYPTSAVAADSEGSVQVTLSIDATGRPAGCIVKLSSGNAELDGLTCKLLLQHAQFSPARDAAGHAVVSQVAQHIRWTIPHDALISRGYRMTYTLNTAGHIAGCKIDEFGDHDPDLTCDPQGIEKFSKMYLKEPLESYTKISILLAMRVDEDSNIDVLRSEGGERKILAEARFGVSPAGVITECVPIHVLQIDSRSMDMCGGPIRIGAKEFESSSTKLARTLTVSFELTGVPR